jgi:hypothetical protein
VRTRLKPKRLEEKKIYYTSGSAPGYFQNGADPETVWVGFYTEKSSSKQAGSAEAEVAVSCSRLQYIMSAQLWRKASF